MKRMVISPEKGLLLARSFEDFLEEGIVIVDSSVFFKMLDDDEYYDGACYGTVLSEKEYREKKEEYDF